MRTQDKTLKCAEEFVRKVLVDDLNQKVSQATVHDIALKVTKAIPAATASKKKPNN